MAVRGGSSSNACVPVASAVKTAHVAPWLWEELPKGDPCAMAAAQAARQ